MKKYIKIISILMCALLLLSAAASAEDGEERVPEISESVLNVSPISREQAELCTAVVIDGFEADETERVASEGTVASLSVSAFEGERCMRLAGNGRAEITLEISKRRNSANTRSLCVCVYAEPAEGASFDLTVTARGESDVITATAEIPSGLWCAAYMPLDTEKIVEIKSVTARVSANASANVRVSCLIDRVHTATVDGLPDRLKYFASGFTAENGELEYTEDALIFRPSGPNARMESLPCGYLTGGRYNALAVKIENNSSAETVKLRLMIDDERSYSEEHTHTQQLQPGKGVYYFPIGGFRSGTSVGGFRLEFSGDGDGEIAIEGIEFSSYRFPAEYAGTVYAEITDGVITVYGNMPDYPASTERVCLYRLAPGFDEEEPGAIDDPPYAEAPVSGSFSFELPAEENGYNNTYFKYLVRYETETGYEDAGAAYVSSPSVYQSVSYKGTAAPEDLTLLSYLMPGAVYADLDIGRLFTEDGNIEFKFAGRTARISEAAFEKCDAAVERCRSDNVKVVVRLVFSPFPDADKYYFIGEKDVLPNLTTFEGTSHYMALLSFIADRYDGKLSAVIPCGTFNSAEIAGMRGQTQDKAEKYAADLIFAAKNALSTHGAAVTAPIGANGAETFLNMLSRDLKEEKITVYAEADSAGEASETAKKLSGSLYDVILSCRAESTEDLVCLFCGCSSAAGICVRGLDKTDARAELFSVIDSSYGMEAANKLAANGFPDGVAVIWPGDVKAVRIYDDKGTLEPEELPPAVTSVYDGSSVECWQRFDNCKSVYADQINGENAAALAFDGSYGCFGYASFYPESRRSYDTVYFKLYADYLPDGVSAVRLRITAEGDWGVIAGCCTLEAETAAVIPMRLDTTGRIKRFSFAPLGTGDGAAPRICVAGIYTPGGDLTDTATEELTETEPESGTETRTPDRTEITTGEKDGGENNARIYIIAILVIIGMFALCGVVILILKKRDKNKTDEPFEE